MTYTPKFQRPLPNGKKEKDSDLAGRAIGFHGTMSSNWELRRPLMADKSPSQLHDEVAAGIARRLPYYTHAHVTHPGEQLEDRRQIAATVEALLPHL